MNKYQLALTVLDRALTTRRPHGDASTVKFCAWLMKLLPTTAFTDACGNIHVDLRSTRRPSKSLFVAHVDTVHRSGGKNKVVKTDKQWSAVGAPLGADDGAGVALLMHMIAHGVPGYYIFTQGEEVGGIGAGWLAENMTDLLRQFDRAIAFDRRATYSVITHQGRGRCASDEFGDELSDRFNKAGMLFASDDTGVYTDTAEFIEFIPECTNISAGYDMEHTERETLDMEHFMGLARVVIRLEWETLPVVRKAVPKPPRKSLYSSDWLTSIIGTKPVGKKTKGTKGTPVSTYSDTLWSEAAWDGYSDPSIPDAANENPVFMEALEAAIDGAPSALCGMLARHADPLNPRSAEKQINKRLLSEGFLCQMYDDSFILCLDTLLSSAFEEVAVAV